MALKFSGFCLQRNRPSERIAEGEQQRGIYQLPKSLGYLNSEISNAVSSFDVLTVGTKSVGAEQSDQQIEVVSNTLLIRRIEFLRM